MRFFFLGERLAVDLLNTVVVQDGRVHLLQGPMDVAAWAEAAGVLPHGALRGSAAGQEPERLREFRETLRRGGLGWGGGGGPPSRGFAAPQETFGGAPRGPGRGAQSGRPGSRGGPAACPPPPAP